MERRLFLFGAAAAAVGGTPPGSPLGRAIRFAGGAAALRRARTLAWQGEATIHAAGRRIDIGVSTRVTPFVAARSDTWLRNDGPAKTRSLVIERDGGWIEGGGTRTAMPAAMLKHERAQYALYGLMRLVSLSDPGASAERGKEADTLIARHPGAPDTLFGVAADGRLSWAINVVPSPDGAQPIHQRFVFSGIVTDQGVRWPARIEIDQDGTPFFDLRIARFRVDR